VQNQSDLLFINLMQVSSYLAPPGAHTVSAKYGGDAKNLPSQTANALTVVQDDFMNASLVATTGLLNRGLQFSVAVV